MDDIERIKKAKAERLAAEKDARIRRTAKLLGVAHNPWCPYCGMPVALTAHASDCKLASINPDVLADDKHQAAEQLRKEVNKQRIFKSDKPRWSGLPSGGKTLVRKRRSKNRGPARELQLCAVCHARTLFENGTCSKCKHSKPCSYNPLGKNCHTCHPGK